MTKFIVFGTSKSIDDNVYYRKERLKMWGSLYFAGVIPTYWESKIEFEKNANREFAKKNGFDFYDIIPFIESNDKEIIKIDRFFPSSKTCNCCGYINQNLKLDMREWVCPSCKTKLDRDLNASINILKEGYKQISSGTDDYRRGDEIRPTSVGTIGETSKILNDVSESQSSFVIG
jgi:hypothetical protein